jgi:hypothetical protein
VFPKEPEVNEEHSTHEMVKNLHSRFGAFEERIDERFTKVESRVGDLEKSHAADIAHLEKHESEACLKESAILASLNTLTVRFDKHAEREEIDRRWLLSIVIGTLLSSVGTLGYLVLTGGTA